MVPSCVIPAVMMIGSLTRKIRYPQLESCDAARLVSTVLSDGLDDDGSPLAAVPKAPAIVCVIVLVISAPIKFSGRSST